MDTTVYDGSSQAFTIGYDGDSLPILESKGEIVALLRQDMNEPNMRLLRDAPALLAEVVRLREALTYLLERAEDSDDACRGTLSTDFVRAVVQPALAGGK